MPLSASKPKPKPSTPQVRQWCFEAIGTQWCIEVFEPLSNKAAVSIQRAIRTRIAAFDRAYSRFRADSFIMRLSRKAGTYHLPADGQALFDLYAELYELTDGAVTPLIGS